MLLNDSHLILETFVRVLHYNLVALGMPRKSHRQVPLIAPPVTTDPSFNAPIRSPYVGEHLRARDALARRLVTLRNRHNQDPRWSNRDNVGGIVPPQRKLYAV